MMKPPILSFLRNCPDDLLIFQTVLKAEAYLEWPDIENQEYEVYDSAGRPLCAFLENAGPWWRLSPPRYVKFTIDPNKTNEAVGIHEKLIHFLSNCHHFLSNRSSPTQEYLSLIQSLDLEHLIDEVVRTKGYTR